MLTRFTIPDNAAIKYPIIKEINDFIHTDSWFDYQGREPIIMMPDITDQSLLRCEQIKVFPTITQRLILLEWFEIYRYIYNETVKYIRISPPAKGKISFISLRKIIKDGLNKEIKNRINKCKIPSHTIDNAVHDVVKAYKSAFALAKTTKRKFRIRYKKSKSNQILTLETSAFSKKDNSFSKKIGNIKTDKPINNVTHDSRMSLRNGEFMLYIPRNKQIISCDKSIDCCSLDPGLKIFQTIYCDNGETYKIGKNISKKLEPIIKKIDEGRTNKYKRRLRARLKHLVDDLHWKSANQLCKLSNCILIGNMSTIGIVGQKMQPMTKRLLYTISQYTFQQRLKAKCEEYGVKFMVVNESYTSKTCGGCGELNNKLGSSRHFKCDDCNFSICRDINGARNIMIKQLQ